MTGTLHPADGRRSGQQYEAIAIVGLAARLPGAGSSAEKLWTMIREGQRARSEMPADRVNIDAHYHPSADRATTTNVRHANWLDADMAAFDAPFFSIQPLEAESMDPQQRMLLETSYQALENAGIPMEHAVGSKTSVFVASTAHDYEIIQFRDPEKMPKYMSTGTAMSLLSNRISWFFDFRGPSISLDTACSGSLSAMHLACQSLRNYESNMAIVGGVSLNLVPEVIFSQLSTLGFLSPDGCSYSFDERANGYGKGEGLGVVVLKRVGDAVRDGDTIRAIIRSSSVNQDGRTPGITQPSKRAQKENILQAYELAGLSLDDTTFFEAHGTGTAIGDPFEAEAIHSAFQRTAENPLYVGAFKANIGHLEAGAGIAATIKAVHILEHGIIPPIAGFEKRNPNIPEEWGLKFLNRAVEFPKTLRRMSVNSFGYGGTNAHVIIDDAASFIQNHAPGGKHATHSKRRSHSNGYGRSFIDNHSQVRPRNGFSNGSANGSNVTGRSDQANGSHTNGHTMHHHDQTAVLLLSAADEPGIKRVAKTYEDSFARENNDSVCLSNLAYTLSSRRSDLPWKAFAVVSELPKRDFASSLSMPVRSSSAPAVSCIFTGQGAQWYGMARGLTAYPLFYRHLQHSGTYLRAAGCEWDLMDELHKDEDLSRIDMPELAQTLCTALQIALVDLFVSWNIRIAAVTGHSSGEIAAAYCIGALSHESAILVAWHRGRIAASVKPGRGSMMAVALSASDIKPHLETAMDKSGYKISIGCINAPANVTITGDTPAIDTLQQEMETLGIFARKLQVDVAYHSHHMAELADEYRTMLAIHTGTPTGATMFSSVTGCKLGFEEVSKPEYWVRNLVQTVRFADALGCMSAYLEDQRTSHSKDVVIEVGPHPALQRPSKDILKNSKNMVYDFLLWRNTCSRLSIANAMGRLRCQGYPVNLALVSVPKADDLQALTTLPPYSFNHSQSYWSESRISRGLRFRERARHELLGVREADWNPLLPKWRNIIRITEHPWISGYRLDNETQYPAAGLIVMAIEAARELSADEPASYLLTDISFPERCPLSDSDLEAQVQLIPRGDNTYDFLISVDSENSWAKVCEGSIKRNTAFNPEERVATLNLRALHDDRVLQRWEKMQGASFYSSLSELGYDWQAAFQNLDELRFARSGTAFAKTECGKWRSKFEDPPDIASHVIHPVDLDAIIQSSIAAHSQAGTTSIPTMQPSRIDSMWISGSNRNHELRVQANTTLRGSRHVEFSIGAVDFDHIRVLIEGCRQTLTRDEVVAENPTRQSYRVEWRPDVDLTPKGPLEMLCGSSKATESTANANRQELVCLYYMFKALDEAPRRDSMPHQLAKYVDWIRGSFQISELNRLRQLDPLNEKFFHVESREKFLDDFAQESYEGNLFRQVGENLASILRGEVDALEFLYGETNLANEYFKSTRPRFSSLMSYLDLLAFKNPNLNILEVGAGSGSMTGSILQTLLHYSNRHDNQHEIPRLAQYTFTDISPAFFKGAQVQFDEYEKYMRYATFNLERDPLDQGFEEGSFDVVVANMVLYATSSLSRTLKNIRKVLKPNGKLIIFECTAPNTARAGFSFGLLPGWWLSDEKERKWSPLLSPERWNSMLQLNGFTGIDIHFPDSTKTYSGFVTSVEPPVLDVKKDTIIIATAEQQQLTSALSQELSDFEITTQLPEQFWGSDAEGSHLIILVEMLEDFFGTLTEQQWQGFLRALWTSKSILWVTNGAAVPQSNPMRSIVTGFGRAIRSEDLDANFVELALASQNVEHIARVYRQSLWPHEGLLESEYMEIDGCLCVGRLSEAVDIDRMLFDATGHRKATPNTFGQSGALQLTATAPGHLETLCFDDDLMFDKPLAATEVEIEVAAAGITFEDLQIAVGELISDTMGYGCSGIISRVGAESLLRVGDRVCACTINGSYKTFVRAESNAVSRIPDRMSFADAASLPVSVAAAHFGLITIARLQSEESVLITNGLSGIGQAAIQLARDAGARVFTTCASNQHHTLGELYDLPASQILNEDGDFASQIKKLTGEGVDVAFHSAPLPLPCVAPFGRNVELIHRNAPSRPTVVEPNVSFHAVEMYGVIQNAGSKLKQAMTTLEQLLHKNVIQAPQPMKVFSVGDITEAFRSLHQKSTGGTVVQLTAQDIVPVSLHPPQPTKLIGQVLPSTRPSYNFHAQATYVVSGGLGGLGGAMVEWMADRGARYFLLLSRSGGDGNEVARTFIANMKARGVYIYAPKCDISNAEHVAAAVKTCKETMPAIRGCIQGAMVLREMLLQGMTAQDVHDVLRPKTLGTLNLDAHMPDGMDFFVLLSSISSLAGFRGIGNYAAANTFLDAFARSRASPTRPCLSLDLGAVKSIGVMADRGMTDWLLKEGLESLATAELFALLDWACNPTNPSARTPADAQLVTGLAGVETMRADHFQGVYWSSKPMFRPLIQCNIAKQGTRQASTTEVVEDWAGNLAAASNDTEAQEAVLAALIDRFARLLAIPRSDVDVGKSIQGFGIDSLITMELRQWVKKMLGADVAMQDMLASASIEEFAGVVAKKSDLRIKS